MANQWGLRCGETRQRKGLWSFLLKITMAIKTGSHSMAQAGLELMAILHISLSGARIISASYHGWQGL